MTAPCGATPISPAVRYGAIHTVAEPAPADGYVDYPLDLFARLAPRAAAPADAAEGPLCTGPDAAFAADVTLVPGGSAGQAPAVPGRDISLSVRSPARLVFAPQAARAVVALRVYADEQLEADARHAERLGEHPRTMSVFVPVIDYQRAARQGAGCDASFTRVGPMCGALVTEALSDRFSCSRSRGCTSVSAPRPSESLMSGIRRLAGGFAAPGVDPGGRMGLASVAAAPPHHIEPLFDRVGRRLDT